MNKKIIIGSMFSAIILFTLPFYPVIGIQTEQLITCTVTSPLFRIRTMNALNLDKDTITINYFGMNKETEICFPIQDNKTVLLQKIMQFIDKMDDKSFNHVVNLVINRILKKENINKKITLDQMRLLYQLKDNQKDVKKYLINLKKSETDPPTRLSFADECCLTYNSPSCYFFFLLLFLFWIAIEFIAVRIQLIYTLINDCLPTVDCLLN